MNMVNFNLLMELVCEAGTDSSIQDVISVLAMNDIPMSDAVIQLGIAADVLLPDYENGWSQENEGEEEAEQ